jgi:hypothetical protein
MGPRNNSDRDPPRAIQDEIERLEEVLSALSLGVEVARATLVRLQDVVGDEEEEQQGQEKLIKGCRVKILPRKNEPWTTRKYAGQVAKVVRVTSHCVFLKIPGRVDELRRNKEFVKLSK